MHAHLSGSVRYSTLIDLIKIESAKRGEKHFEHDLAVLNHLESNSAAAAAVGELRKPQDLDECFKVTRPIFIKINIKNTSEIMLLT